MNNIKRTVKEYCWALCDKKLDKVAEFLHDDVVSYGNWVPGLLKDNVVEAHKKLFEQFDNLQVLPLYTYFDEDTVACRFNVHENGANAYELAVFITVDEQGLFKEIRTFKNCKGS